MDRMTMLQEILAENPNDVFARYGLALELGNSGRTEEGLAEFGKLVELNPDYVPGSQMYAQTLLQADRSQEARPFLGKAIAYAVRTANAHAHSEMQGSLDRLQA